MSNITDPHVDPLKKKKMDPALFLVLVISGGVHAIAALVFGSMVMYKAMKIEEPEFKAPPKKQLPPKKIQYKVQTKTKSKPKPRKITVNNVSKINMPKIDVKMPKLTTQTDFTNITNMGSMRGFGSGGLGMSGKAVTLLKVQAKGERFLFMVDASARAMSPAKGGFDGFDTIRQEIVKLIKTIPSSIVFNMAFIEGYNDRGWQISKPYIEFFKPSLLAATDSVKTDFNKWIYSINTEADFQNSKVGLGGKGNWKPELYMSDLKQPPELVVTQAAIEQKADVVFMINGGWNDLYHNVERRLTAKEEEEKMKNAQRAMKELAKYGLDTPEKIKSWLKARNEYYQQYSGKFEAYKKKMRVTGIMLHVWVGKNFGGFPGWNGITLNGLNHNAIHAAAPIWAGNTEAKGAEEDRYYYKPEQVDQFLDGLQKKAYNGMKNKKLSMNVIVFIGEDEKEGTKRSSDRNKTNRASDRAKLWNKEAETAVKKFVRNYNGKFRLLVSDVESIEAYGKVGEGEEELEKLREKIKKYEDKLAKEKNTLNKKSLEEKIAALKQQLGEG